jgi:hypothetical protein
MSRSRNSLVRLLVCASAIAAFSVAPGAQAAGPDQHFRAHSATVTTSCSGGSGFVSDGNALFGQQTETAAWNAGDHGTTCGATLN